MYVERNLQGAIVGAFANIQPGFAEEYVADDSTELLDFLYPTPSKTQRIAIKLQAGGFPTKGHLYYFIENMRTVAALKLGITDAQAHAAGYAGNPMYKQMVDLYNEILAIEAEP